MSSHYKLYDGLGEIVPFNARYAYPTQANRSWKQNIQIPTNNGQKFYPGGSNPQITLPAQGYLNTRNTFLSFDVAFEHNGATVDAENIRFQNNIQSIFDRMQLRYGSLPLEDLRECGPLIRILTDGAATNTSNMVDQNAISEGIGGATCIEHVPVGQSWKDPATANPSTPDTTAADLEAADNADAPAPPPPATPPKDGAGAHDIHFVNVRSHYVQVDKPTLLEAASHWPAVTFGSRRYMVQLPFGMLQQNKLLPLKWMASQVTIELTLASILKCIACEKAELPAGFRYTLENVRFNAELIEFDGSYDAAFLEGLRKDGVPIKFASWDTFTYTPSGGRSQTLQMPERNRSLKAAFCVQIPPAQVTSAAGYPFDSHALLQSSAGISTRKDNNLRDNFGLGHVVSYQWRIGGKYYPAQPVSCGNGTVTNGGAEAYREFEKALNIVGDYRLSTGQNPGRWCHSGGPVANGRGYSQPFDWPANNQSNAGHKGLYYGPSSFVIALDMETSSGAEVSGLNGEEQNDISLTISYSDAQSVECQYNVYIYYDALLVLRENNLVEVIK